MTEQLRRMADEAFVEILAQRVVEKLLARQKQALVVYTVPTSVRLPRWRP